jgi:cytochrome oxidase assembly protein ShyY1
LPRPELGNGPHLSYAGQWFIFASIAAIGYLLVLRKVARSQTRTDADVELR